jgi:hypothetical protein
MTPISRAGQGRAGTSTNAALGNEKFQIKSRSTFSKIHHKNTKFPDTVMKITIGVIILKNRSKRNSNKNKVSSGHSNREVTASLCLQY